MRKSSIALRKRLEKTPATSKISEIWRSGRVADRAVKDCEAPSNARPGSAEETIEEGATKRIWRSGRVAEGAPLLREYTLIAYRGFESLLLRHPNKRAPIGRLFCLGFEGVMRTVGSTKCAAFGTERHWREARRNKTAYGLFWVIPPSPPSKQKCLPCGGIFV